MGGWWMVESPSSYSAAAAPSPDPRSWPYFIVGLVLFIIVLLNLMCHISRKIGLTLTEPNERHIKWGS